MEPARVRSFITSLIDVPCSLYHLTLFLILLISKSSYFKEEWTWNTLRVIDAMPIKLMGWPIKMVILLHPLLLNRLPLFPSSDISYIIMVIILQLTNGAILGLNLQFHCSIFPSYCYENYDEEIDEHPATTLMFLIFQVIIGVQIGFVVWFIKSIKSTLYNGVVELIQFFRNQFFNVLLMISLITLIVKCEMQNFVMVMLILQLLWKVVTGYFTMYQIMNYALYDFSLFMDDYEDVGIMMVNPEHHNPRRVRFLGITEYEANYNGEADYAIV